ncbi:hypothetical protein G443_004685 [Actinoalloteichus cyanogriseus DSM 43889]|uniref:Uncharacterized protein n=1 Tax=Actinoalloteichus caeruleus DSM 43889 TaxID=1120930 RepID=A0ABT1JPG4_ACTCY|nr:hypothetical protein [Actinoalloteichus caeruleus DSM 43889]
MAAASGGGVGPAGTTGIVVVGLSSGVGSTGAPMRDNEGVDRVVPPCSAGVGGGALAVRAAEDRRAGEDRSAGPPSGLAGVSLAVGRSEEPPVRSAAGVTGSPSDISSGARHGDALPAVAEVGGGTSSFTAGNGAVSSSRPFVSR